MTKALIIGGGIAGAVTAMALGKAGISAEIYEAYPTGADDIGAFLTIMRNGLDALRAIEAHQPVIDAAFPAHTIELLDHTGTRLGLNQTHGEACTIKRATLYKVLHASATNRGIPIIHGKRLTHTTSGTTAHFADGTTATGDLIIGADGIHSTVRTIIDPTSPPPRFTGLTIAYGYTHATTFTPSPNAYRMISGSQAAFGYTTDPTGETWWFSRAPHTASPTTDYLIGLHAPDQTEAAAIVRATESAIFTDGFDVPETPVWHNSTMVLTGDAAHAASPAAGQGASMALEDSVILAQCLRDVSGLERAFELYTGIRKSRVEQLVAASAGQGAGASRRVGDRAGERNWLYDHHIEWDSPVLG
jgi:2-polyprenyl-6-methoxyphenol hydroxylase-like FAD-dependent oxidoreductase